MKRQTTVDIRHDELKDEDLNWREGVLFRVRNLRIHPATDTQPAVVRFNGDVVVAQGSDALVGTGYDGGVYGARADVQATIVRRDEA